VSRITIKELSYSYHGRGGVTQVLNRASPSPSHQMLRPRTIRDFETFKK